MNQESVAVSRTLVAGVSLSFVLLVIALLESFWNPVVLAEKTKGISAILNGIAGGDPVATADAGLLVLMLTPILRVVVLLVDFSIRRDLTFLAISIVVLLLLAASVTIGVA